MEGENGVSGKISGRGRRTEEKHERSRKKNGEGKTRSRKKEGKTRMERKSNGIEKTKKEKNTE